MEFIYFILFHFALIQGSLTKRTQWEWKVNTRVEIKRVDGKSGTEVPLLAKRRAMAAGK